MLPTLKITNELEPKEAQSLTHFQTLIFIRPFLVLLSNYYVRIPNCRFPNMFSWQNAICVYCLPSQFFE
jgi:hypothetical protein